MTAIEREIMEGISRLDHDQRLGTGGMGNTPFARLQPWALPRPPGPGTPRTYRDKSVLLTTFIQRPGVCPASASPCG